MPLGASTLNRKWVCQVNSGTFASPVWLTVQGRTEFQFARDPQLQDDSDFDGGGFGSQTKTAENWSATMKVSRKVKTTNPAQYDDAQELLRLLAIGQFGAANTVDLRVYEYSGPAGPLVEAYRGFAAVQYSPDGGGFDALDMVSLTLTGQGQLSSITHPLTAGTVAPTITSLQPTTAAVAGGASIKINGSSFATVTSVTVGGVAIAATAFQIISDALIVFTAPAKSAGAQPVVVVNPSGSSAGVSLTYA